MAKTKQSFARSAVMSHQNGWGNALLVTSGIQWWKRKFVLTKDKANIV